MNTMHKTPTTELNVSQALAQLRDHLQSRLVGKPEVIQQVIICLLSRGHILFEDMPGLGKTTLAKAIAEGIAGSFARVQCTPDLLPSDITGFNMFNQKNREFEFRRGPVFSDIVLTDEINRTPPRTQSALFEAMAERQVTVDGETYSLSPSFFVIATQNPMESHGVFPLPEAQLDRFAMKLSIGYPAIDDELGLMKQFIGSETRDSGTPEPALSAESLQQLQQQVTEVQVHDKLLRYMLEISHLSRERCAPEAGLSPRANLQWLRCAQASAFLAGRDFVVPEDLQQVALPVLSLRFGHLDVDAESLIQELLQAVAVPTL